jgi:hypothetical protein
LSVFNADVRFDSRRLHHNALLIRFCCCSNSTKRTLFSKL